MYFLINSRKNRFYDKNLYYMDICKMWQLFKIKKLKIVYAKILSKEKSSEKKYYAFIIVSLLLFGRF